MQGVRFLGKKGGTPRAVFPLPRALGEGCLESRRVPARAPQDSRARWTPGRGVRVDKVGGGRGTPGLPYLARPAPARREAERSPGARGSSSRSLAGSAALRSPPARPLAPPLSIAARPAPGPARPRPLLRPSPLPVLPSQSGLRLPPDSSTAPRPAPPARLLRGPPGPELSAAWC